jgi:hypothetical protein
MTLMRMMNDALYFRFTSESLVSREQSVEPIAQKCADCFLPRL